MNNFPKDLIPLGKIVKTHGIKGELKVFLYNDESNTFEKGLKIWFENNNGSYDQYNLYSVRGTKNNLIIKIDNINNIEKTNFFLKKKIFVSRQDFTDINQNDNYYLTDLIGLKVIDENNNNCGLIVDVLHIPANDVIVIKYKNKEIMVPIVDHYIKLFDFKNKLIKVKDINSFCL